MKVYVALELGWEETYIVGVFTTEEDARKAMSRLSEDSEDDFEIEEHELEERFSEEQPDKKLIDRLMTPRLSVRRK